MVAVDVSTDGTSCCFDALGVALRVAVEGLAALGTPKSRQLADRVRDCANGAAVRGGISHFAASNYDAQWDPDADIDTVADVCTWAAMDYRNGMPAVAPSAASGGGEAR